MPSAQNLGLEDLGLDSGHPSQLDRGRPLPQSLRPRRLSQTSEVLLFAGKEVAPVALHDAQQVTDVLRWYRPGVAHELRLADDEGRRVEPVSLSLSPKDPSEGPHRTGGTRRRESGSTHPSSKKVLGPRGGWKSRVLGPQVRGTGEEGESGAGVRGGDGPTSSGVGDGTDSRPRC